MDIKKAFPILEFDEQSKPVVTADKYVPEFADKGCDRCVITYFSDVVDNLERIYRVNQVFKIRTEGVRPRVYFMPTKSAGKKSTGVYVVPMPIGAPQAARVVETLVAVGVTKFMVCGGAGSLYNDLDANKTLLPVSAVRDEGTSYHYLPPSREVGLDPKVEEIVEKVLKRENEPYEKVKTWSTDGIFRETAEKVKLRISEGCGCVEMECATFYAVAEYMKKRNPKFMLGQILYAGDVVATDKWDYRDWHAKLEPREKLFELATKCLLDF